MSDTPVSEVLKVFTKSKGDNTWKAITVKKVNKETKEVSEKDYNLIVSNNPEAQKKLETVFDGPGQYRIVWQKNGNFYNIASAEKVGAEAPKSIASSSPAPVSGSATHISTVQNPRVIAAASAIEGASVLIAAYVARGAYDTGGTVDDIIKDSTVVAGQLFKEFQALVNPVTEKTAEKEPVGA